MTRRRIVIITGILLLAAIAGYVLLTLFPGSGADPDGWNGYHVLLCPEESAASRDPGALLEEGGLGPVLSLDTVYVTIADFAGGHRIPLSELDTYFFPGDPRCDPFLKTVTHLFRQSGYRIYFIKSTLSSGAVNGRLRRILSGVPGWVFPSHRTEGFLPSLFLLLICLVFHLLFSCRNRTGLVLGLLPGAAILVSGGGYVAMAGFVLVATSVLLVPASQPRIRDTGNLPAAAGIAAGAVLLVRGCGLFPALTLLAAALLAGALGWMGGDKTEVTIRVRSSRVTEHPLFEPVYLGRRPSRTGGKVLFRLFPGAGTIPLLVILLAAVLLPLFALRSGDIPPYPVPAGRAAGFSFDALSSTWEKDPRPEYPGAAAFVAHRFYQENLLYDIDWGFPFVKKSISISTFSESGGRITKSYREIETAAPGDWSQTIQELKTDPLFELYWHQGGAVGMRLTETSAAKRSPFRWWEYVFFLFMTGLSGVSAIVQLFSGKRIRIEGGYAAEWRKY